MIHRGHIAWGALGAAALAVSGCGPGVVVTTAGPGELRAALTAAPEELELTAPADREKLYDALALLASDEAVRARRDAPVLFPVASGESIVPAPFAASFDLLRPASGGPEVELVDLPEAWPTDAQPGLFGASERELADRVARSLLGQWGAHGRVSVVRTPAVPFAAAFVDGKLRLNPALLYLAVARRAYESATQVPVRVPVDRVAPAVGIAPDSRPMVVASTAAAPVPVPAAPESLTPAAPAVPAQMPVAPIGGAGAGVIAAGLLAAWLIRRR